MIITFSNTFFCINHDTLFHVNMCDYNDHKEQIASLDDMMRYGYKIIPLNDYGVFCCAKESAFLSPQPDGTVAHAARSLGWE